MVWTIWALVLGTVFGLVLFTVLLGPGVLAAILSALLGLACAVTWRRVRRRGRRMPASGNSDLN